MRKNLVTPVTLDYSNIAVLIRSKTECCNKIIDDNIA